MNTRTKRSHLVVHALATMAVALTLAGWEFSAQAQLCIQSPGVVPGLSGPPIWAPGSPGVIRNDLYDPRWAASPLESFPQDASVNQAAYRVLQNGNQLSISLQSFVDTPDAQDSVYFGFTAGGTVAHLARIYLPSGATDPVPVPDVNISYWDRSGGTWSSENVGLPPWLKDPALPAGVSGIDAWVNLPGGAGWAINLKADVTGAPSPFQTFFAVQVHNSGTSPAYYLPDYAGGTALIAGTIAPSDPAAAWQATTGLGTACLSGISIDAMHVATTNIPPDAINTTPGSTNTFFAEPSGIPAPVTAGKVLGKFRFANWGATIADPHAPWDDIPGGNSVPSAVTTGRIQFDCTPTSPSGTCPTLPAGHDPHQCVLVELRSGTAGPQQFARASVYRNMNFMPLSTLSRDAQISLKGLQAVTGAAKDRDVYLYIKTKNLPPHGNDLVWLPREKMDEARRYAEAPPPPQPSPIVIGKVKPEKPAPRKSIVAGGKQVDAGQGEVPPSASQVPPSRVRVATPYEAVSDVWPTYEVHAYYDTGKTTKVKNHDLPLLRPMVPFGFFLSHDGPLYGFTTKLEALNGVVLQPVGPNYYRVHMANESAIAVKTTITAEEKPNGVPDGGTCPQPPPVPLPHHCSCGVIGAKVGDLGWALTVLSALGGVIVVRVRRRRRR